MVSNAGIAEVQQVKQEIKLFLETELHLELSEEKTRITHVNEGFDFLGFHIQRVMTEGHWAIHLRPTRQAKERVKRKVKILTSRNWAWLDEYTRLTTLNTIVRGWAQYYRYTSLLDDIQEVTRYVWHRYLKWLLKKHKGSRPDRLIKAKNKVILNRKRWTAEIREGDKTLKTYQWEATRQELDRRRYHQKGRNGFAHPYLFAGEPKVTDYPMGEVGPEENIYTETVGVTSSRVSEKEPLDMHERKLRAKMRDGLKCVRCGSTENIQAHHIKGTKSHRIEDLETLCLKCHQAEHGYRTRQPTDSMESRMI